MGDYKVARGRQRCVFLDGKGRQNGQRGLIIGAVDGDLNGAGSGTLVPVVYGNAKI